MLREASLRDNRSLRGEALPRDLMTRCAVRTRDEPGISFGAETGGGALCCVLMRGVCVSGAGRGDLDVLAPSEALPLLPPHLPQLRRSVGLISRQRSQCHCRTEAIVPILSTPWPYSRQISAKNAIYQDQLIHHIDAV